jgi:hypothetical protein
VLVVTRLLFLTAFSYTGYPRLLQKSQTPIRPFTLQVSRFTASNRIINDLTRIILIPQLDVPFLLRSQGSHPTPLQALQFSMVGGVSSDVKDTRSRPPAHQPTKQYFMDMKIKILIYSRFSKGIFASQQCLYFPTCVLHNWRSQYDRIDLHKTCNS